MNSIEDRLDTLESVVDDQQAQIEAHKETIAAQQDTIEAQRERLDAVANDAGGVSMPISRRRALQAGGALGLLGLGAGTASAQGSGQIGTSDTPVGTIYTETLNGGITGDNEVGDLVGWGLEVYERNLRVAWSDAGGLDQGGNVEWENADNLDEDGALADVSEISGSITEGQSITRLHGGGLTIGDSALSVAPSGITTFRLAADAVTTDKIADAAVDSAKLAEDAVGVAELDVNGTVDFNQNEMTNVTINGVDEIKSPTGGDDSLTISFGSEDISFDSVGFGTEISGDPPRTVEVTIDDGDQYLIPLYSK